MTTYDIIKGLADEKKISIAALERSSGIGNGVIARWKEGSPRSDLLYSVAKTLGVTMDDLMPKEVEA